MTNSLGDRGLPVFHAGHRSWQRPHSVQVEKSSRPFQVKSSMRPTPRRTSGPSPESAASMASSSASMVASVRGSSPTMSGWSGPRALEPSTSRRA